MEGFINPVWGKLHQTFELVERHDYESAEWIGNPEDYRGLVGVDHRSLTDDEAQLFLSNNKILESLIDPKFALHRLRPSWIIPEHRDLYRRYRQSHNNIDLNQIIRIIVFLEDWQPGHILQIDRNMISNWLAGNFVSWRGDTPHLAANLGITNRYTLQITGIANGV